MKKVVLPQNHTSEHCSGFVFASLDGDEIKDLDNEDAVQSKRHYVSLIYGIEDTPRWPLLIALSIQNFLTQFGSLLAYPYLLGASLCIEDDRLGFSEMLSTIFFVSGITTIIQTAFGIRLPIVQGSSFAYIMPVYVMLKSKEHLCPDFNRRDNTTLPFEKGSAEHKALWQSNLNEINGCVMVASLLQIFVGATGLIGVVSRYVGPLTISTILCLLGISIFRNATEKASSHWGVCIFTIVLVIVFSQFMSNINVPFSKGVRVPIFSLFPVLFAVIIGWMLCLVLTLTNALPEQSDQTGYLARTDIRTHVLWDTPWFTVPYPGQWGMPTVSLGGVIGMTVAVMASILESLGDYQACNVICGTPTPPSSSINRGIAAEGLGGLLGGAMGTGGGSTSYSQNIVTIGLTRVASRSVVYGAGVCLIFVGCLGKFGGIFAMIPEPVIAGIFFVNLGLCFGVGISALKSTDISSTRNQCVLGLSVLTGLSVAEWTIQHSIYTGNETADQVVNMICSTHMFVGGVTAFILDNAIPGTRKERGFPSKDVTKENLDREERSKTVYDLPFSFLNLSDWKYSRYIPILPAWNRKSTQKKSPLLSLSLKQIKTNEAGGELSSSI